MRYPFIIFAAPVEIKIQPEVYASNVDVKHSPGPRPGEGSSVGSFGFRLFPFIFISF